ncbi:MAG TPA: uroporphyrinogen-III C-methyltransferase, partial [Candidatus Caenarcaniphilales bacterium]
MAHKGKVYLIGAGPGAVAYLTVQAYQLLRQAEVIVYDALVDPRILELAPESCLRLDVGKRGGQPSPAQGAIDRLLVAQCQQQKRVVRLKSGDPFIYGRALSEIQALHRAGCEFEVVPGLSSALAAPLLAGIPLTDPNLSPGFAVFSAHDPAALDWQSLAQLDTLVLLMGGQHLPEIVAQLQQQGRSPQFPIAVIRRGGWADQQVWRGCLNDIIAQTAGQALSPAVIVIGEVVQVQLPTVAQEQAMPPLLHIPPWQAMLPSSAAQPARALASQEIQPLQGPLAGKTILVTRAAGQSPEFSDRLQQQGA